MDDAEKKKALTGLYALCFIIFLVALTLGCYYYGGQKACQNSGGELVFMNKMRCINYSSIDYCKDDEIVYKKTDEFNINFQEKEEIEGFEQYKKT